MALQTPTLAQLEYQYAHADEDISQQVVITVSVVASLSIVFVSLRLFARWLARLPFWWDDYVIILALIFVQSSTILGLLGPQYGLGRHEWTIEPGLLLQWGKLLWAYEVGYDFTINASKISVLLMYSRIFPVRRLSWPLTKMDSYSAGWWFMLLFVISLWIAGSSLAVFQCTPVNYFWTRNPGGSCINQLSLFIIGFLNITADTAVLALPVRQVLKLQVKTMQKFAIIGVILLGGLCVYLLYPRTSPILSEAHWSRDVHSPAYMISSIVITSIIRNYYLITKNDYTDVTYSEIDSITWSCLETYIGIICACLPTLGPLFWSIINRNDNRRPSFATALRCAPSFSFSWHVPARAPVAAAYNASSLSSSKGLGKFGSNA